MSGTRRQRDTLAPSLFPFLAVLLCTMGALVLILMLIVAGAQTAAKEVAAESQNRIDEAEELLEHTKNAFAKQLTEGRIALEKKRLILQHLETHIRELMDELEELKRTAELVEEDKSNDLLVEKERKQAISELEKQLAEATQELEKKLEKPAGDKPIFAIIPYQGSNGTHRRPIYLECTSEGVVIQPEGIRLSQEDLEPPYGPGNPLDAALRTIRAEFPPSNGAVTSTAYPLLVVRPSGIRTYTQARAAMSGWDDQFGYELINEDLELAYPKSTAGLKSKLTNALELARDRQAALVMAMPNKYRQSTRDYGLSSTGSGNGRGGTAGGSGDYPRNTALGSNTSGGRGGFSLFGDPPSLSGRAGAAGNGFGTDASTSKAGDAGRRLAGQRTGDRSTGDVGQMRGGSQYGGVAGAEAGYDFGALDGVAGDMSGVGSESPSAGRAGQMNSAGSSVAARGSSAANSTGPSSSGTTAPGGMAAGSASGSAAGQPGRQQFQPPAGSSGGGSSSQSASANSTASTNSTARPSSSQLSQGSPSSSTGSGSNDGNASEQSGMSPQMTLNKDLTRSNDERTQPVARARGRDWAWSQGPPTETPVVRSIRMQCLNDRWLVLPESGRSGNPTTISFDLSPKERAEQLARVVLDRVDSWGLALMGGYWKPVLVVDVAEDAQWRYAQLQQLLDGSGLEVQLRAERPAPLRR